MAARESPWDGICLIWHFKDQVHSILTIPSNMPKSLTNTLAAQLIHNRCKELKMHKKVKSNKPYLRTEPDTFI